MLIEAARERPMLGGELIAALFRGEDSTRADAGAVLIAEGLEIFRLAHTKK